MMTGEVGYEEMPLRTLGKSGAAPRERMTKPSALRNVFVRMREDDLVNAANRAECQSIADGEPPFVQSELVEAGQGGNANINFRGVDQQVERAMAPYYRLVYSTEKRLRVKTRFGPQGSRAEWNEALSEEISDMIRRSAASAFHTLLLIHKRTKDGLGIAYFSDYLDWRFKAGGLDQFFFERQKYLCEDDQEIVCSVEEFNVTRLYDAVDWDGSGGDWNRDAVRKAILGATSATAGYTDWGVLVDEMKNNDMLVTNVCPPVRVIHGWIKEFDGTWSHYMTTEEALGDEGFLYKCRGMHRSLNSVLTMFPDGLGTNAKIHGVRGLLYKIYPMEQYRNRFLSRMLDQGMTASSLMLQAQNEEALSTAGAQTFGNQTIIGPEWKANPVSMPDLQRSVIPAIDMMERLRNDRVAGYTTENVFDGDKRKTKFEVGAHLEQAATLSEA
ncbi:MAG TPA: hypothetical protein VMY39_09280, partial [Planctomycetota bacterium]|nr:hypothetical protein [Planctomycetota bacterium]